MSNRKSKIQKITDYLEKGNSLTKKECLLNFSYWNLGDVIFKLRKEHGPGYVITTMKKTLYGEEYAEYALSDPKNRPEILSRK